MPGARSIDSTTPLRTAKARSRSSAATRRRARGVCARRGRVSSTRAPAQSPYTPEVEMYTRCRGIIRALASAASRCRVRGSSRPSEGGGARCSTANGAVRSRSSVRRSSRSPTNGTMPLARSLRTSSRLRVRPISRARWRSRCATRSATSPQPMSNTRCIMRPACRACRRSIRELAHQDGRRGNAYLNEERR